MQKFDEMYAMLPFDGSDVHIFLPFYVVKIKFNFI